jgi:hypothetical protein
MAQRIPLTIDQGTTFSYSIQLQDRNGVPLSTANTIANASMRKSYASSNAVDFTTDVTDGVLTLTLEPQQSANMEPGRYVYDALLTDTSQNTVTRAIEGVVTLKPAATKIA